MFFIMLDVLTEQHTRKEEDAHAGLMHQVIAKGVLILLDSPQSPFSRKTPVILECYLLRLIPFIISATVLKACIVFPKIESDRPVNYVTPRFIGLLFQGRFYQRKVRVWLRPFY